VSHGPLLARWAVLHKRAGAGYSFQYSNKVF
jgi:hypothetical protein